MQEGEKMLFLGGGSEGLGGELAGVNPSDNVRGAVAAQESRLLNLAVAQSLISNSGQNWLPGE